MQQEIKIDHVTDDDGLVTQLWSVNLSIHVDIPEGIEVEYYDADGYSKHLFVQVKPETDPDKPAIFFDGYETGCECILEDSDVHMDKLDRLNRNL